MVYYHTHGVLLGWHIKNYYAQKVNYNYQFELYSYNPQVRVTQ